MIATYTVNVGDNEIVTMKGSPDKLDEIVELMKNHSAWTYITDDLPYGRVVAALARAGSTDTACAVEIDGYWMDILTGKKLLTVDGWYAYAWRPWPTPPPLPSDGGEKC